MEQIKLPITFKERIHLDGGEHRFGGTFKTFCQLLQSCEYPVEYQEKTIIIKSVDSDAHEQIAASFIGELGRIFKGKTR